MYDETMRNFDKTKQKMNFRTWFPSYHKKNNILYLEGRMNSRTIPRQKSKAAILNQITSIIIYRFRH